MVFGAERKEKREENFFFALGNTTLSNGEKREREMKWCSKKLFFVSSLKTSSFEKGTIRFNLSRETVSV